jgi:electron transfer flavoprotein alpha subunit
MVTYTHGKLTEHGVKLEDRPQISYAEVLIQIETGMSIGGDMELVVTHAATAIAAIACSRNLKLANLLNF